MDALYKRGILILIAIFIIMVSAVVVAYFIGRSYNRVDGGVGREFETATIINSTIRDEQQRTLDAISNSASDVGRSLELIEAIRGITKETDSSLRELGELNRRSSDISAQIREEALLLADYFWRVSSILSDYDNNSGGE